MMSKIDEEMVVAHFIVSDDVERSRRFYTEVLGGKTVISSEQGDEVTYVALANSWIIINVGGGPTDDKPTVTLETPQDPDRVSSFLNIRVADIDAVYSEWSARGDLDDAHERGVLARARRSRRAPRPVTAPADAVAEAPRQRPQLDVRVRDGVQWVRVVRGGARARAARGRPEHRGGRDRGARVRDRARQWPTTRATPAPRRVAVRAPLCPAPRVAPSDNPPRGAGFPPPAPLTSRRAP